ncbi:MAG: 1-acyl-sn-glycerol-3-phosphate acyltransferase [Armatimonadetes bacterium]|nr:1-acyl-sn-glycerol-3-phosphate acyltransferase [Armatimonadota bacterium]
MTPFQRLWYPVAHGATYALFWLLGGFRVYGLENLPRTGPFLLAANHLSVTDPLAIQGASPRKFQWMTARELLDIPWLRPIILFLGAFPVSRDGMDPGAMATARSWLRKGEGVVIFPEGRITADGSLQKLHPGLAVLALREEVPVLPVIIRGTDKMHPIGAWLPRPAPKSVTFGKLLHLGGVQSGIPVRQQVQEALQRIRQALLQTGAVPGLEDRPVLRVD